VRTVYAQIALLKKKFRRNKNSKNRRLRLKKLIKRRKRSKRENRILVNSRCKRSTIL
jgi:hypothetical protein